MWAVIPVKELRDSKQRLASVLSPNERGLLVCAMLEDVLVALAEVEALTGVLVVTGDDEVGALAATRGALVIREEGRGGLNEALGQSARYLESRSAAGLLVLPADVPTVKPKEIDRLLQHHGRRLAVTLVSDRHGLGTNALACSPPGLVPFQFGPRSFSAHLEAARRAGALPKELSFPGLELDVDTPADLQLLIECSEGSATRRCLNAARIGERLGNATVSTVSGDRG